ncbi:MAG TPA: hypothetical protein O0X45_02895, partial [Methanocorpusculum sp.]|nr:hypothetical protein [Methanocorpusculum sp.]
MKLTVNGADPLVTFALMDASRSFLGMGVVVVVVFVSLFAGGSVFVSLFAGGSVFVSLFAGGSVFVSLFAGGSVFVSLFAGGSVF